MMDQQKVYCPGSISLIFKVHPGGSTGVGFTIDKGVVAIAKNSTKNNISFNGKSIKFPTVADIIDKLTDKPVSINLQSPLPLGCGFGLSGASALSTAKVINKLFNLRKSKKELLEIAYNAEIKNKTGLGTVVTQSLRGCIIKHAPGLNPKITRLPFNGQKLYCEIIGKLETPGIIGNKKNLKKINAAADRALSAITEKISFTTLMDISSNFAKESSLVKIARLNLPTSSTMLMLGRVILTIHKPSGKPNILEVKISNG